MKQFGNATFRKAMLATSSAVGTDASYVVLANLPPVTGKSATHAAMLTATLAQTCPKVVTLSECRPSYTFECLDFATRARFIQTRARTRAMVGPDSRLVVYTSALGADAPFPRSTRRRLLQNRRRILLSAFLALRARSTTIVFDSWNPLSLSFWLGLVLIAILLLFRPRRLHLASRRSSPAKVCAGLGGRQSKDISPSAATDAVFALTRRTGTFRHLDVAWLETAIENCRRSKPPPLLVQDLEEIAILCRSVDRGAVFAMQTYGRKSGSRTMNVPPRDKFRFATSPAPKDTLPRIARHFRQTLPAKLRVPRRALCRDADFYSWYAHSSQTRNHIPALPLPQPFIDKIAKNLKCGHPETLELLLSLARRGESLAALPDTVKAYFHAPVGGQSGNLSRLELICAILAGVEIGTREVGEFPWQSETLRDWFSTGICSKLPALSIFSTSTECRPFKRKFNISVTGIVTGHSGLARNAEMHIQTLRNLGLETGLPDAPRNAAGPPRLSFHNARNQKRSLVLHNANASQIPLQVLSREIMQGADPVHVGFLLWELRQVPRSHMLAGEILDDIWVPSRFVQEIYQNAFDRQIFNIGKSIHLPDVEPADLNGLGIGPKHKLFLIVFDSHSMVERKNPLAGVRAFLKAFPDDPEVRLLVKTTPAPKSGIGDPCGQLAAITKLSEQDPRIIVEQTILPFRTLLARIRRADCIISPHRSEGFGYIPAYALYFGRPAIVTDYSGTQEFCTPETAFPIPYKMTEVGAGAFIDDIPGALWADIDTDRLADTMQYVATNPEKARVKANAGKSLVRARFSPEQHTRRVLQRLLALGVVDA